MAVMMVLIAHKTLQHKKKLLNRAMHTTLISVIGMVGEDTLLPKNSERSRKTLGDGVWLVTSAHTHAFEDEGDLFSERVVPLTETTDVVGCGVYFDSDGMIKLIPREVMQTVERL